METVRFSQVVAKSGSPEPYTLWVEPKDDKVFQRTLTQQRIMSVHQETVGTKADYGEVGYTGTKGELLLFPKSLKTFAGKRVIGVKYELLAAPEPEAKPARKPKAVPATKPIPAPKHIPPKPKPAPKESAAGKSPAPKSPPKAAPAPEIVPPAPARAAPPAQSTQRESGKIRPFSSGETPAAPRDPELDTVRKTLRKAMKALKAGKAVQAYELLSEIARELGD